MRLLFLGDVSLHSYYPGLELVPPFQATEEDIIVFNLETPVGRGPAPLTRSGMRLFAPVDGLRALSQWQGHIACLANNHILDAGAEGLANTLEGLTALGMRFVGAGCNGKKSPSLSLRTSAGSIGILNWATMETTPDDDPVNGAALWPGDSIVTEIVREFKQQHQWVIVVMHWGVEILPFPSPQDRARARLLADAGADFVIGIHPHVVRGGETIGNGKVFYSLGNYYFGNIPNRGGGYYLKQVPRTRRGMGVEITLSSAARSSAVVRSYRFHDHSTALDPSQRAEHDFRRLSAYLTRPFSEYEAWYEKTSRKWNHWGRWWHFRRHELHWSEWPAALMRVTTRSLNRWLI